MIIVKAAPLLLLLIYTALVGAPAADISLLVLDFKYSSANGVQICEIQPGNMSRFNGAAFLQQQPALAQRFSELVHSRLAAAWYQPNGMCDPQFRFGLSALGWQVVKGRLMGAGQHALPQRATLPPQHPETLADYVGAVYLRGGADQPLHALRRRYPGLLFIDAAFEGWLDDKLTVNGLLDEEPLLRAVKPRWQSYPGRYSAELVAQIMRDFTGELLVIKPLNGSKGNGVIISERQQLPRIVEYILTAPRQRLRRERDPSYSFWGNGPVDTFIVEEYAPSDPLYVEHLDGQPYDPTLRAVVALVHDGAVSEVCFLGGYCKLPARPLSSARATLNQRHKSWGHGPLYAAIPPAVWQAATAQLEPVLLRIYEKVQGEEEKKHP